MNEDDDGDFLRGADEDDYVKFGFTEDDIEAFKWRVEALANGVLRIQAMAHRDEPTNVIRQNRYDLCRQAAKLINDICGDWVKLAPETDAKTPVDFVALSLFVWMPVLAMNDRKDFFWSDVLDEIERLKFGDEPEILRPVPRMRGEHRQPGKLARSRANALMWAEYLKSKGLKPREYKAQINLAFGADWDAIRKWRESVARVYSQNYLDSRLKEATSGYWLPSAAENHLVFLHMHGHEYREIVGLPELPLDAFLTSFGKING